MGDRFYDLARIVGRPAFWVSSAPVVLGAEHARREGAFILAANHQSPYDIPLLMRHCDRRIDFISIVEVFENPVVAALYGALNAFPLDRSRPDVGTVKGVVDRLRSGRVVGMFPEGQFRKGEDSVLRGGKIRVGIGRIAEMAGVAIVPAVIVNSGAYSRFGSWLPLRRTVYGVAFGEGISPSLGAGRMEEVLVERMRGLHGELLGKMGSDWV